MAKDITGALTWADSAAANTAVELIGTDGAVTEETAIVHIHNPSTVTALTVSCRVRWTDNVGTVRDSEVTSFVVAANTTKSTLVEGFAMGLSVLRVTNNTALGVGQGFTARARVEFAD